MLERNVGIEDIAKTIGRTTRAVRGKIAEETSFTYREIAAIKNTYFADIELQTLFASDNNDDQRSA